MSRKKKNKIVKKIVISIFFLIFILANVLIVTNVLQEDVKNKNNTSIKNNIENPNNSNKEEYIYKEELLKLKYSVDDISIIEEKIKNKDVKKYLLSKKYDNLTKFISSPYFKIENIDRYESYYSKNSNLIFEQIVLYVSIGLDYEFYTNIKEINDYDSTTTIVNKYNKLPDNFEAKDLVNIDGKYATYNNFKLKKVAYDNLINMMDNAKKDNINLTVVSAYRTYDYQKMLFNNSVKNNGEKYALTYSAKPGHSEHQLGLAIDFNDTEERFDKTNEYKWLKDNAYKYGFIERYPKNKEYITGFGYEPWHYRYLGIDIASKIFEENITYEEYVVKYLH